MSKLFGGKDPFDDLFFTEQFDGDFGSKKDIMIEELDDDDGKNLVSNTEGVVKKTPIHNSNESNSFSFRRVAYGGLNGVYYSSSIGQRTGNDGVVLLEIKEEDKTVGQALHTISRGIHEKGHTLTKKRDPNGKEDSLQILHNLNEDELDGFEENWKVNADKNIPGWNDGFDSLENKDGARATSGSKVASPLLDLYGHLGWNDHGAWDGWTLPWTNPLGTDGAMVTADEPTSGLSTSARKIKRRLGRLI